MNVRKVVSILCLVLGVAGVVTVTLLYTVTGGDIPFDYGVMVDAGSGHSGVFLYKWQGEKNKGTGEVIQASECHIKPGVSSFANPMDAGDSLLPCLRNATAFIPKEHREGTHVYLGATAGMRLLEAANPYQSLATFTGLRCSIPKSSLIAEEVGLLSGQVEGVFAWITTNFLMKTLKDSNKEHRTVGAADMGGASTQIAFEVPAPDPTNPNIFSLKLYGEDYHVYSATYLCYGSTEIFRRYLASLVKDRDTPDMEWENPCGNINQKIIYDATYLFDQPCTKTKKIAMWIFDNADNMNQNYTFKGTGKNAECKTLVEGLFDTEACAKEHAECFSPIAQLNTADTFLAFASFYWTMNFLKAENTSLEDYRSKLQAFCQTEWKDVWKEHERSPQTVKDDLPRYCFQGHQVDHILTGGYKFNATTWANAHFTQKVNKVTVGWALGYMINATNAIPAEKPTPPVISTTGLFVGLLAACAVVLVAGAIFCIRARRKNNRSLPR